MSIPAEQPAALTPALTDELNAALAEVAAVDPDGAEADFLPLEILHNASDGSHTVQFPLGRRRQFLTPEEMLKAAAQLIAAAQNARQSTHP
ncbi:hypothetical protein ACIBG7_26970 [Nonomuraea sp. NPDC050328]|uniref:hypothetical protein n=1 Tax=Nonomuraea sp. NPDC050328 TaxID=3364361 RepID=UPI0037A5F815